MIAPEIVKKALNAIKRPADYQYFFSQLKSPDWLLPLWKADFFRTPPSPIKEGLYTSFPVWPESRYLVRMASSAPETVLEILLTMPDTENVRVHEDALEAALAMPPDIAAKLSDRINAWANSPRLFLLPERLGQLISHYAKGEQIGEAIKLARTVLAVFPGDDIVAELPAGKTYRSRQDPVARFEAWTYRNILKKRIPDLIQAAGQKGLLLLSDLLDSALRYRRPGNDSKEDFSYIWRPTIEREDDRLLGIANLLISAVRDAAEQICKKDQRNIAETIAILEKYQWPVFRRICLHLIRVFSTVAATDQRLTTQELFQNDWHEYTLLLRSQFPNLPLEDQNIILSWIEKGPDLNRFTEYAKESFKREPSLEEIQRYSRHWQLERLAPLRDAITGEWKSRYDELVKEFGTPRDPEESRVVITSWVGPTSPRDSVALQSMTVEELVDFLKSWQPPEDPHSPTPEGLGRELTPVVASDPQKFAPEAHRFRGLDATYVRSLLAGFRNATGQNLTFEWKPVLDLCLWTVAQPREFRFTTIAPLERDPHWGWARKTVAELLKQGFVKSVAEIPFNLRESAWVILELLTRDPEPTPEYEQKYGGSNMDPAHIAINTTRGEAMQALIYYALWIDRNLGSRSEDAFDRIPEVREVLDEHINNDPSVGVRSVYGRFFPQLLFLDRDWTEKQLFNIFPLNESLRHFFEAAWDSYILFCNPIPNVIEVLEPIYALAIHQLSGRLRAESEEISEADRHLAAHLFWFYLWGKLQLQDTSSLLRKFWLNAHPKLRGYFFEDIGRTLAQPETKLSTESIERIQQLWQIRLDAAKTAPDPKQYKEELAAFSWCFGSGRFDDLWATDQLKQVLNLVNKIDFPTIVVERLAVIATDLPLIAVECLRLIVDSELESWEISGWRNEAKAVLKIAIESGDSKAQSAAIYLAHRLGAKGYFEFREVLPRHGSV